MGPSGARHHRVPGRRGGGARRRARPALPAPAAERQARRAASPATGGADPRGAGARGASVDRRRHARGGAAGAPARRGGRRAQEPVRRRGRDPGSGEDGGTPMSGIARKPRYTADDLAGFEDQRQLGRPGEYPFTRGIHPTMYRGRLWTMRQVAGFGSAQDTNERYKFLLDHGQTGLSVAFDFPTLMGYDSDHPRAEGEVGKCGVAISSLADMEDLFRGIPLDRVSTSMTINGPAAILFCFYVAAAERQGVPSHKLRGTIQNDILKEYMAQHAWIYPVEPALKIIVDVFEWAAAHAPLWNTISISGYHIREAGATAAPGVAYQALAAVLGGTQSLHTNSLDETLALPTEEAVRLALRTQQIIAHETGVPEVIDPLGGSYYVESLTDQLEREAEALFAEVQSIGGVVQGIESGWFQRQIARSAEAYQREVESGNRVIVGVNDFGSQDDHPVEILRVSNDAEDSQRRRLARLRAERDAGLVQRRLDALTHAAESEQNVIGPMLDCARAYCTLYEIRHALERVHGAYREPVFF